MSTLWTPGGEHEPRREAGAEAGADARGAEEQPSEEEVRAAREQLARVRGEVSQTPAHDIVANHAIGLWQLAVIHLGLDQAEGERPEPNLDEAKLAVDAMAGVVETLGDRLGEHREALTEALTNLRLGYVRLAEQHRGAAESPESPGADT